MLSRPTSAAIRANSRLALKTFTVSKRFNSSEGSKDVNEKSTKKNEVKAFYNTYSEFMKTQKLNENGEFITERPTEADFENSELAKYLAKSEADKNASIEAKLKELADAHKVSTEELKKIFENKVALKRKEIKSSNEAMTNKINTFVTKLSSSVTGKDALIPDLLDALLPFAEDLSKSPVFEYIYHIDPAFAKALGNVIRTEPTEELVQTMTDAFKHGPISQITDEQYQQLKETIEGSSSAEQVESGAENLETEAKELTSEIEEQPVDGLTVLEIIFSNLNSYDDINNSPLLKLIEEIDGDFAALLKGYETIDPTDETRLKEKYEEIFNYCSDKSSKIYKAFGDSNSVDFAKVKKVLEQPLPIDLSELYEVFEFHSDYFESPLFSAIQEVDPTFAKLLQELETLPEGEELDAKNNEIDAYLVNKETDIYKAMNDITSDAFANLRSTLNLEWETIQNTVTPDKLVEYAITNGLDSDGFKLISKIDPEFSEYVTKIYNETNEEEAMKHYASLQEYLESPNAIIGALEDKSSLNYKLLSDLVFGKPEEYSQELAPSKVIEEQKSADSILEELLAEDQSKYPEEVRVINETYDLTLDVLNEIETELKNNTFIPVSRQVSEKLDKLLGFQPSKAQIEEVEQVRSSPPPKQTDEVLELAVNIIMKDGKKEAARKYLNRALYLLFLETRSNPVEKFKEALDIVAPVVVTKTVKTGFAKNYTVPVPLTERQRNRMALLWILKSSDSKASNDFSVRLCDEILHVLSGKSALMDKRVLSHKLAIANRSYLTI